MKKTLILFSILTLTSYLAKAQDIKEYVKSYFSLEGGISNPMGDFGSYDYKNNSAGFAKRSVTFGLDGVYYFYKNLGIGGNFSFADQGELTTNDAQILANGYNADYKENTTSVEGVGRYHLATLMFGPQYSFTYHKFILDLRANAGVLKSFSSPSVVVSLESTNNVSNTLTQSSSTDRAFTYGGTAGIRYQFADGWDIGVRFNYIKSSGININNNIATGTFDDVAAREVTKQPITILQSTFGIAVHF